MCLRVSGKLRHPYTQPLKTGSIYTYIHPVIILDFTPRCETLFNKTSPRKANISPSREPNDSHQVGLQNKFRFHVGRLTSGLFYENRTELDEVGHHLPPGLPWGYSLLNPYESAVISVKTITN